MSSRKIDLSEIKDVMEASNLNSGEGLEAMLEMSARVARENSELSKEKRNKFWFLFKRETDGTVKFLFGTDPQ